MGLLELIITIVVIGLILWAVNTYIPMEPNIKKLLTIVVIIAVVLWLFNVFGILGSTANIHVGK